MSNAKSDKYFSYFSLFLVSFVCLLYMHKDLTLIVNKCTALM